MELIAFADLGTPPAGWQFTFTSIPQTFHTLKLIGSTKGQSGTHYDQLYVQFEINGSWEFDSGGSNYEAYSYGDTSGYWTGGTISSEGMSYARFPWFTSTTGSYTNDFGGWEITIGDYTNGANIYKSMWCWNPDMQSFGTAASYNSYLGVGGGAYDTNSSGSNGHVTGIRVRSYSGSNDKFSEGSSLGLYGLD